MPIQGNPMKKLFLKLKRLKVSLKTLNNDYYSDISTRVRLKREEIEKHQILTLRGVEPIDKELELQNNLNSLEEAEAMFLKQKAKIQRLKEEDKCTRFFHSIIVTKRKKDTIRVIVDDQGRRLETFDDMSSEVVNCFKKLLGSHDLNVKECSTSLLKDLMLPIPPSEDYDGLTQEVTSEEIKEAIFSQRNDKAPSPDGYTSIFFKKAWLVVGNKVIKPIKFFIQESYIYSSFNATTITLVPKILNPSKVSDFHHIYCCSIIYKAITKVIVYRLTHLLPKIISSNQSIFVKGRSIIDNTLISQEIVKGYGRKTISPRCALKINLQKDFDSIHWSSILTILKALKIPNIFIEWIVACYSTATYSIAFIGSLIGYFKGARGLRQGDPFSLILFVMVMNILSNLLNKAAAKVIFNFHHKCKKICLTHLTFADDLLIFCKGNLESVMGVTTVLDYFYEISGLKLNVAKCEIFSARILVQSLDTIINSSGFKHITLPVRYLGIPLVIRKLTVKDCQPLIDKVKIKLHQWSRMKMCYAGKLELIKTILFSVANYRCRKLILPQSVINKIEKFVQDISRKNLTFQQREKEIGCNDLELKLMTSASSVLKQGNPETISLLNFSAILGNNTMLGNTSREPDQVVPRDLGSWGAQFVPDASRTKLLALTHKDESNLRTNFQQVLEAPASIFRDFHLPEVRVSNNVRVHPRHPKRAIISEKLSN
ncbi:uncharacterized protein LOC120166705 [Hibiscus syriacus]|uniref:uncharacterized protein LOC120166705 n=1 Tax=Hibiscus syriacus TaxID=106335 RepID=UPI00192065E1|nr:uncharacterized protein LOC120166705 [Hibiscus syriacus]